VGLGFEGWGYGGLEREVEDERGYVGRMRKKKRKEKQFLGGEGTGTVVPHLARAVPTFWKMEVWLRHSVGRAKVLVFLGSIFFVLLNHAWTITYKTT